MLAFLCLFLFRALRFAACPDLLRSASCCPSECLQIDADQHCHHCCWPRQLRQHDRRAQRACSRRSGQGSRSFRLLLFLSLSDHRSTVLLGRQPDHAALRHLRAALRFEHQNRRQQRHHLPQPRPLPLLRTVATPTASCPLFSCGTACSRAFTAPPHAKRTSPRRSKASARVLRARWHSRS